MAQIPHTEERAAISSLTYYPGNPRVSDIQRLAKSLNEGQYAPFIVQKSTRYIIAGNHRVQAAEEVLGWTHVDVWIVDVDDDMAREIVIKDNRLGDLGAYDPIAQGRLLEEATEAGVDIETLGYDFASLTETLLAARKAQQDDGEDPETWGEDVEVPVEVYQSMNFKIPVRYVPLVEATLESYAEGNLPGAESGNTKGYALIRLCEQASGL